MAQNPADMAASMVANLKEKTGRSIDQWVALAKKSGLEKHGQIVAHLKKDHELTHGYANLVAHTLLNGSYEEKESSAEVIDTIFKGKEALRPVFDALMKKIHKLGSDVEESPKKGYMSLRRNKQFALLKPSTKTRFDLGLQLKGVEAQGVLEPAGSLGMVTHKIALANAKDVNAEVMKWVKQAYEAC